MTPDEKVIIMSQRVHTKTQKIKKSNILYYRNTTLLFTIEW